MIPRTPKAPTTIAYLQHIKQDDPVVITAYDKFDEGQINADELKSILYGQAWWVYENQQEDDT